MSSGIFIRFKMHPIYQSFLRKFYNCYDPVFSFPREDHDELGLTYQFKRRLAKTPYNYKPEVQTEDDFLIEIPYMKDRKPTSYNYMGKNNKDSFVNTTVRKCVNNMLRERILEGTSDGLTIKRAVEDAMEYYGIPLEHYETVWKEFQRWRWRAYKQKKARKKSTMVA